MGRTGTATVVETVNWGLVKITVCGNCGLYVPTRPTERAARKGFDFKKVGNNKLTHVRGEL